MPIFTTKPPTDLNDDYYKCMCGVSVHSFMWGLSIFEIVIGFVMLVVLLFAGPILLAPFGVIAICLGLLLLWGNRKKVWQAYVLELCQWICSAFTNFLVSGLILFYGVAAFFVNLDYAHFKHESDMKFEHRALIGLAIVLAGLLHLMFSLIFFYFTCVVLRGFQYVYKFGKQHEKLLNKEAEFY